MQYPFKRIDKSTRVEREAFLLHLATSCLPHVEQSLFLVRLLHVASKDSSSHINVRSCCEFRLYMDREFLHTFHLVHSSFPLFVGGQEQRPSRNCLLAFHPDPFRFRGNLRVLFPYIYTDGSHASGGVELILPRHGASSSPFPLVFRLSPSGSSSHRFPVVSPTSSSQTGSFFPSQILVKSYPFFVL